MKPESQVQQEVRLMAGLIPGVRLWRNNVGKYRARDGRWIDYGLCVGSSDLIGFVSRTVTLDMVGKKFAQFVAIECKTDVGLVSDEQGNFLTLVSSFGGKSLVVRDASGLKEFMSKT